MDKREAMLRELNLYPFWVRRDVSVLSSDEEKQPAPLGTVEACTAPDQQSGGQEVAVDDVASLFEDKNIETPGISSAEDLFAENQLDDKPLTEHVVASDNTLRDFQLKSQGGILAQVDWPELAQKVQDCALCGLRAGCRQTVLGSGDRHADWMFIGEAPGEDENTQGLPFVGHVGRLLDNMMMAIQLKRGENVYIANVIKCRPLDDRHPHVGEIAACMPYLKRQIGLLKPKIIVALGKTAASVLLETDATIASLRGRVHDYKGIPLIVTYHPAYLLRSPLEKEKAWQDLCLAVVTWQAQTAQLSAECVR